MEIPQNLAALFLFIASPVVVGGVVSFVFEKLQLGDNIDPRGKFLLNAIISMIMVLISQGLIHYIPSELVRQIDPIYAQVISLLLAVYSNQATHATFNKSKPPAIITIEHLPDEPAAEEGDNQPLAL